jgi:transcriptional regulator with XRE-family HTH domain
VASRRPNRAESRRLVGEVLRDLRLAARLRQEDVATHVGRPQSYISKVESGERSLELIEAILVAQALGVPPTALVQEVAERLK